MADGKTEALARQLEAAQAITHVGSWEWDLSTGNVMWSDELYRIYGLPPRSKVITFDVFLAALLPEDRDRIRGEIERAMARGGRFNYRERIRRPDGSVRILDTIGEVIAGDNGAPVGLIGTCRDMTEEVELAEIRERIERVKIGEREILEMLAHGKPLAELLMAIVELLEELSAGTIASILLLDDRGEKLRHGAAPHLPEEYNRSIDGALIGPKVGSCGTAAYLREPVLVSDIESSPLWIGYRHLVAPYNLKACSSFPVFASDGRVIGTFAVYYKESRLPDASARELIDRAAHIAGIVIERRQLDDQLRALPERIEAAREEERTNIAREIHDELGQALTALKLDIALVARRLRNNSVEELPGKLDEMTHTTEEIISVVRRISAELRPGILDDLGLSAALEWQAGEFTRRTGIPCNVNAPAGELHLERNLATTVFRIFQEALTNITRHARATRVDVNLRLERGMLKLDICDDGVGVPEISPRSSSLGLLGMRERARRCGGDCTIRRREPKGTVVALTVPLRFPAASREDELGAG